MATVERASTTVSSQRLLTVADVAQLPSRLPSGPVDYELRRGTLSMMSPTGDNHGFTHGRIAAALVSQGDERGLGTTRIETGFILARNPDTLYGPDVMFLVAAAAPPRVSSEGYWETVPTLVVEVRSKNDTRAEIEQKVQDYLAAGVELVWVADPARKMVSAYRRGANVVEYGVADVLTAEDIIPGFSLPVVQVFVE